LAKSDKAKAADIEKPPAQAWGMGFLGWLVPGAGHLAQGKRVRALILGGAIWVSFIAGLAMGGRMFSLNPSDPNSSVLLQIPPMIANLGSGVLYLISWVTGLGFNDDPMQAARATHEYGNTFLLIAGLLNYLVMLDAFDMAAGRKN
jgi:hypothetical protein